MTDAHPSLISEDDANKLIDDYVDALHWYEGGYARSRKKAAKEVDATRQALLNALLSHRCGRDEAIEEAAKVADKWKEQAAAQFNAGGESRSPVAEGGGSAGAVALREALRRLATDRKVRYSRAGFAEWAGVSSCKLCFAEWREKDGERHEPACLLFPPVPSQEGASEFLTPKDSPDDV